MYACRNKSWRYGLNQDHGWLAHSNTASHCKVQGNVTTLAKHIDVDERKLKPAPPFPRGNTLRAVWAPWSFWPFWPGATATNPPPLPPPSRPMLQFSRRVVGAAVRVHTGRQPMEANSSRIKRKSIKADSTLRTSRAVPHSSTNRALCRLTSEVERDPVHSTRYGRQRKHPRRPVSPKAAKTPPQIKFCSRRSAMLAAARRPLSLPRTLAIVIAIIATTMGTAVMPTAIVLLTIMGGRRMTFATTTIAILSRLVDVLCCPSRAPQAGGSRGRADKCISRRGSSDRCRCRCRCR
jgi:hypothetical protein